MRLHPGLMVAAPGGGTWWIWLGRASSITIEANVNQGTLRLLVRHKLQDGRLPRGVTGRIWTGMGGATTCDGCDEHITKDQLVQEVALAGGRGARGAIQFHVSCFRMWDDERHST
jgi:hypothetical protein